LNLLLPLAAAAICFCRGRSVGITSHARCLSRAFDRILVTLSGKQRLSFLQHGCCSLHVSRHALCVPCRCTAHKIFRFLEVFSGLPSKTIILSAQILGTRCGGVGGFERLHHVQ
jgi:hypothetical protein